MSALDAGPSASRQGSEATASLPTQGGPCGLPELEHLELFVRVAQAGSIGQAAALSGLSQPTLSRKLDRLERALKVKLLERTTRGTTLSPAGQLVVEWAAELLKQVDKFTRSVGALQHQDDVAVVAGVSMTIAEHYAPRWIATLRRKAPSLRVALEVHNSADICALVESGALELGFVETPTVQDTFERYPIGSDRLAVGVPPSHPWAGRTSPVQAGDLADAGLLVREHGSGTLETLECALRRAGLSLSPSLAMASNTALKAAAAAGVGPVVLSALSLAPEIATGQLVEVPVDIDLTRPLSAIWPRGETISKAAQALLAVSAS